MIPLDPLERQVSQGLVDLAGTDPPTYLDDILQAVRPHAAAARLDIPRKVDSDDRSNLSSLRPRRRCGGSGWCS